MRCGSPSLCHAWAKPYFHKQQPTFGAYLWCRLPEGKDSAAVARSAIKQGVVLAPGNIFSVSQTASAYLRFNVAQTSDARIYQVLEQALRS